MNHDRKISTQEQASLPAVLPVSFFNHAIAPLTTPLPSELLCISILESYVSVKDFLRRGVRILTWKQFWPYLYESGHSARGRFLRATTNHRPRASGRTATGSTYFPKAYLAAATSNRRRCQQGRQGRGFRRCRIAGDC